jgi:hypothetical protein
MRAPSANGEGGQARLFHAAHRGRCGGGFSAADGGGTAALAWFI